MSGKNGKGMGSYYPVAKAKNHVYQGLPTLDSQGYLAEELHNK